MTWLDFAKDCHYLSEMEHTRWEEKAALRLHSVTNHPPKIHPQKKLFHERPDH